MASAEWPCWKAITTESRETPSEPTRSAPWESASTHLLDEFMRSSGPSFAVAQAVPQIILPPWDNGRYAGKLSGSMYQTGYRISQLEAISHARQTLTWSRKLGPST